MDLLIPRCFRWPWLLVESKRLKTMPPMITVVALATNLYVSPGAFDCLGATVRREAQSCPSG